MKKAGIITIYGYYENYGNRLQNYAVQEILKKCGIDAETIIYVSRKTDAPKIEFNQERLDSFQKFNDKIKFYPYKLQAFEEPEENYGKDLDYFVIGSDQIWNFTFKRIFSPRVFADFSTSQKKVAFSASIGVDYTPDKQSEEYKIFKDNLEKIDYLSVREDAAKRIVKEISNRDDVTVLVDPTMLLTKEEWEAIMEKPKYLTAENYILKVFLGDTSPEENAELERIAKEHHCEIIDVCDEKSPYFGCGPAEFLYLEKNAFLVATDSFHSCVFSILFETPFVVFKREDAKLQSMHSRIETLLYTFNLEYRLFNKTITDEILNANFTGVEDVLEVKRKEAQEFLDSAFMEG